MRRKCERGGIPGGRKCSEGREWKRNTSEILSQTLDRQTLLQSTHESTTSTQASDIEAAIRAGDAEGGDVLLSQAPSCQLYIRLPLLYRRIGSGWVTFVDGLMD